MSVTFTIESNPTGTFSASCYETGPVVTAAEYEVAQIAAAAHREACDECRHYGLFVNADFDVDAEAIEVNLANTNARMMLARLGLDEGDDLCGTVSGEQFLGAVMLALGTLTAETDALVPAVDLSAPGRATFIECGTPEGYTSEVLTRLAVLGTEAVRLGRDISWC